MSGKRIIDSSFISGMIADQQETRKMSMITCSLIVMVPLILMIILLNYLYVLSTYDHEATYKDGKTEISILLSQDHAYLSEYERVLFVKKNHEKIRYTLPVDSGGYTDINLYRYGRDKYILTSYFDSWMIDVKNVEVKEIVNKEWRNNADDEIIVENEIDGLSNVSYLGCFTWTSKYDSWEFLPATEHPERELEPKGG